MDGYIVQSKYTLLNIILLSSTYVCHKILSILLYSNWKHLEMFSFVRHDNLSTLHHDIIYYIQQKFLNRCRARYIITFVVENLIDVHKSDYIDFMSNNTTTSHEVNNLYIYWRLKLLRSYEYLYWTHNKCTVRRVEAYPQLNKMQIQILYFVLKIPSNVT